MTLQMHHDELDTLRGSTVAPASLRPARAFLPGRVCEVTTCQTVLSLYNDNDRCWQHEPPKPFQVRVRPMRPPAA